MLDGAGEDCAAEDCEEDVAEAGALAAGGGGFCAPDVCAKHAAAQNAIAQPSRTTHPAAVPPGRHLAARVFIRHPNRAASMRNPRVPSKLQVSERTRSLLAPRTPVNRAKALPLAIELRQLRSVKSSLSVAQNNMECGGAPPLLQRKPQRDQPRRGTPRPRESVRTPRTPHTSRAGMPKSPGRVALSASSQTRSTLCLAHPESPTARGRTRTWGKASGTPLRRSLALRNQNWAAPYTSCKRKPAFRSAPSFPINDVRSQHTPSASRTTSLPNASSATGWNENVSPAKWVPRPSFSEGWGIFESSAPTERWKLLYG